MKYIIKILFIFIYMMCISTYISATDTNILSSQQDELNISSFIKETEKYTNEVLSDMNMNDIFNSALTGKIDNNKIIGQILNLLGDEIKEAVTILRNNTYNNNCT